MMDDWSLKGKLLEVKGYFSIPETFYFSKDIKTLRKKLIEDILKIIMTSSKMAAWEKQSFVDCINKRFGVKE